MQPEDGQRRLKRILVRCAFGISIVIILCAVALASGLMVAKMRDWHIDRAINRFQAAPSSQRATKLTQLLSEGAATPEQGERILTLLLRPKIVTRSAYAIGRPVAIRVERPFPISVAASNFTFQEEIWANGRRAKRRRGTQTASKSTSVLPDVSEIFDMSWIQPREPGVYHAEIHITCEIINIPGRRLTLWKRLSMSLRRHFGLSPAFRPPVNIGPTYKCQFTVPFDLNMVEKDRGE
jgi:hypothetical protein